MKSSFIISKESVTKITHHKNKVLLEIDQNNWDESYQYLSNYYKSKVISIDQEKSIKKLIKKLKHNSQTK